jgi:hypothetical protein
MSRFNCQHELVPTETRGVVPVYKCRLCGAVLPGSKPETPASRLWLWKYWLGGIFFLVIGSITVFAFIWPGFQTGKVPSLNKYGPHVWVHKDQSPGMYWVNMTFLLVFATFFLAVGAWQFSCIWRERK